MVVAVLAAVVLIASAAVLAVRARDDGAPHAITGAGAADVAPARSRAAFRARVAPALVRVVRVREAVLATPRPGASALGRYARACREARERVVAWRVPVTWRNAAGETAIALEQCAAGAELIAAGLDDRPPAVRLMRDAQRLDSRVAALRRTVAGT